MESRYVHKRHNVSVLMYHVVCSAKYRRVVMSARVDELLKEVCLEIEKRWEIYFLEMWIGWRSCAFSNSDRAGS